MDLLTNYLNFISKSKSQDSDEKKLLYAFGSLEVSDLIITDPSFDMIQGLKNFSIFDELFEIYTSFKLKGKVDPIDDELYLQIITSQNYFHHFCKNHTVSPYTHANPHFSDKLDYSLRQLKCSYRSRALIRGKPQNHNT